MAVLESSMEQKISPKNSPKSKKTALLLAQDLNYAKNLAANDEKVRKRSLKYLKRYLEQRSKASPLTEENLRILWEGLFYAMWMSDKPLVQEECAENIAHLIHCLQFDEAMFFFKVGLMTLQNEWVGIDQLRLDKFLMFVRRLLRQALFVLKKSNFKKHPNVVFSKTLEETILNVTKRPPLGLFMHFTEIYLEEVAKVADGKLQPSRTLDLIKPYIYKLAFANDNREIQWINKFIFTYLMKQHKLGLEYEDKYKIWRLEGFAGSINQIQKVIVSDEERDEEHSDNEAIVQSPKNKPLDPRAGRVDVELPQILFNAKELSEECLVPKSDPRTSKITRNHLSIWADRYQKLHNGIYPLGVKKLDSRKRKNLDNFDTNVNKAVKRLVKFEQQLLAKEEGKKRKRGIELGDSENQDLELDGASPKKKKKKNIEIENTNKVDNVSTKKKSKAEKNKADKVVSGNEINKKEIKEKGEKNKSTKKSKLIELKNTTMKNGLSQKIKEKKLKQAKPLERLDSSISDDMYGYYFKRNSGVWFVTEEIVNKKVAHSSSRHKLPVGSSKVHPNKTQTASPKIDSSSQTSKETTEAEKDEGYEIFIPSKKFVKKLKKTKTDEEIEQVLNKLRGKSRTSLANLSSKQSPSEITPKKRTPKPGSPKKVVINTKLNVSQDIDDHILQVISSPQVPWDSSKKPGKPLLKTPVKASPINPFYRLKTF